MGAGGVGRAISAGQLRRELSVRNCERAALMEHEVTFGPVPSVVYAAGAEERSHGNFLAASYRRICADEMWRRRLDKVYTASGRMARQHDRRRYELECANSSDALLMNVFCYPGLTRRAGVCRLLGVEAGLRPSFGVRARVPLASGRADRTEIDMELGDYVVEAKLTEAGFGQARAALVERYRDFEEVFAVDSLPRTAGGGYAEYQLLRGVLAARARGQRFLLLCDGRRASMQESWFRVMQAVRGWEMRDRMRLLTWQELAAAMPGSVREFLREKYGIETA